jgi:hypothetical protein
MAIKKIKKEFAAKEKFEIVLSARRAQSVRFGYFQTDTAIKLQKSVYLAFYCF